LIAKHEFDATFFEQVTRHCIDTAFAADVLSAMPMRYRLLWTFIASVMLMRTISHVIMVGSSPPGCLSK